jgi:energy-coupling factor transport system ATP-binding protein
MSLAEIKICNLKFAYPGEKSTLQINQLLLSGKKVGIIGANGAGKSTLALLIKGLLRPQQGKILLNQHDIAEFSATRSAQQLGLVFQNPTDQLFCSDILAEVEYGPKLLGWPKEKRKKSAQKILQEIGLKDTGQHPFDLSLLQRRLLATAAVAVMKPKTIIFDEPTNNLDDNKSKKLSELWQKLNKNQQQVIVITHDLTLVDQFDQIVVLTEGKCLFSGKPVTLLKNKDILKKARLTLPWVSQVAADLGLSVCLTTEGLLQKIKAQNLRNLDQTFT